MALLVKASGSLRRGSWARLSEALRGEPTRRGGRSLGVAMVMTASRNRTRGRDSRLVGALVVAALVAAVGASAADAKVWFNDLGRQELHWDQRVSSTIINCPGNDSCRETVEGETIYLRRGAVRRTGAKRHRLRRLGRISATGTLTFRVPHVSAGRYHLVFWSTVGDWDRWMPVSGTFRVARR